MISRSLRSKLIILFIVLALIPIGLAGREMLRISRDELKSMANDELYRLATQISSEIDNAYQSSWVAPLLLIRNALDNPELSLSSKISLLYTGTREIYDVVAIQLSVEGAPTPAIATQEYFLAFLRENNLDPVEVLRISDEEIAMCPDTIEVFRGNTYYVEEIDTKLLTIIMPLQNPISGRKATLAATINLNRLRTRITNDAFNENGILYLLDINGKNLLDASDTLTYNFGVAHTALERLRSGLHNAGVAPYTNELGQELLGAYSIPQELNWTIVVEKKASDAYLAVEQMRRSLSFWILAGIIIAVLGAIILAYSVTKPLRKLSTASEKLAKGDLKTQVEGIKSKDEIGQLSHTFNKMVNDLNHYIDELTETTKAKERAESELKLAHEIQQSFLPTEFIDNDILEFYGACFPAREVGGDYFDYFPLDEDHYGFVIGDVSGKGVPAALFMAVSRTLFRMLSQLERSPEIVVKEFNRRLVELDNGAQLFITLFYCVYNVKTGKMLYSTAGHNPPLLHKEGGNFTPLPKLKTLVAGIMDDIPVQLGELDLEKGDVLILYTDGMTEAINEENEEYGEERLMKFLDTKVKLSTQRLCLAAVEEVNSFQTGMPQFDDMTFFALKIK